MNMRNANKPAITPTSKLRNKQLRRACAPEEYVRDGFVSAGDPLMVTQLQQVQPVEFPSHFRPPPGDAFVPIAPFSIGYIKGSGRICTLLTICKLFIDDAVSMQEDLSACLPA